MSTQEILPKEDAFDYPNNGALFEGVLSRRFMAFVIDFIILSVIIAVTTFALFILGIPTCLLYTSPSPRDLSTSRMPSSA